MLPARTRVARACAVAAVDVDVVEIANDWDHGRAELDERLRELLHRWAHLAPGVRQARGTMPQRDLDETLSRSVHDRTAHDLVQDCGFANAGGSDEQEGVARLEEAGDNLAVLDEFFREHADLVEWVRPSGGMTIFPRLRDEKNARSFCEAASARGVVLAPGDCFGFPAHFRLGFGACDEGFEKAVTILSEVLATRPARTVMS